MKRFLLILLPFLVLYMAFAFVNWDIPYRRVHRVNRLIVCSWIFAVVSVPLVYLLYVPYTVFKTLADGDEFKGFYVSLTDYLLVPFCRYLKLKRQ